MRDERIISCRIDERFAAYCLIDFLTERFTYRTREEWLERIAAGELAFDGAAALPETVLEPGMTLHYRPGDLPEPPVRSDYKILFEDKWLIVIDKPGNLPVHPAGIFFKHTLWYILRQQYGAIHFVNRLDRETSGIVIAAREPRTAGLLAKAGFAKEYLALAEGRFEVPADADGFLIPDTASRVRKKRRWVKILPPDIRGESARTILTPVICGDELSLVKAVPVTGRMHQIRATLYSLGYPLAGDKLYGYDDTLYLKQRTDSIAPEEFVRLRMRRQALHAGKVQFAHPVTGRPVECRSPLPDDFIMRP